MRGSDLLVRCLEKEGVKYIFGIPGEENLNIMDSLLDSSIIFIQTRHEQAAAFMADIYGRLTGKPGVCLSTLGPGATNLVTGVADANMDSAPLVAITGQAGLDRIHKESHQTIDVVSIFRPITKWNSLVQKGDVIPEVVRKAFKIASTERLGATHIDFPEDVAGSEAYGEPLPAEYPARAEPTARSVKMAAELISQAKYPLVLAGAGVTRAQAAGVLREFAEKLNIPVAHTFMGKGMMPDDHELSLMAVGLQAQDYISCGFNRADLIIAVGYDMVEYHPRLWNPGRDKKIVHISMTPSETDASYCPAVEVLGDISASLSSISSQAAPKEEAAIALSLRPTILEMLSEHSTDQGFPLKPQRVLHDIRKFMGREDLLISDVGAHKLWIARLYPCYEPNTCIIANGFAAMGIATPGGIVARLLYPGRKVLAVTGDGGFMMNSQELETAMRVKTPFVVLIFNDGAYGVIKWKQMTTFGRTSHVDFGNPDFVKYAESFGAKGYRVQGADELLPILGEAFSQDVPAVIDCPVDYRENIKLTEKLGSLVCPI